MKKTFYCFAFALLAGCAGDGGLVPPPIDPGDIIGGGGGMLITSSQTVLGDKLDNPYSVANMRKALESLAPEDRGGLSIEDISTSHFYVKFRPANYDELDRIKQDTTLILYDIPLDYEITSQGEYYHDPSIPDSLPTYQYASVEFAHRAAIDTLGVAYDVLENLFIPDEDRDFVEDSGTRAAASGGGRIDEAVADALVERSLELTGNAEEPDGMTRASKWRPAGQITYYDEVLKKTIGMEGLKVYARRWFTTHTGIVNANGYYSCNGRFKRPADYWFDFERAHFAVYREKRSFAIGTRKTGSWNYEFTRDANRFRYFLATVFRGCYFFCYKNIEGLGRPPQSQGLRAKIKVRCYDKTNDNIDGQFSSGTFVISFKHIEIYNPEKTCDHIYATTIHELAHSAHWRQDRFLYNYNVSKIVKETWARGVQVYFTRKVYPDFEKRYPRGSYTGLVEDLMDEAGVEKTSDYYLKEKIAKSYIDNVSGYTIKEIESALIGARTFNIWKNQLKSKYPDNATKDHLDAAFTYWSSR